MATGAGDDRHGAGAGATAIPSVILNTGHAMPVLGFGTGSPSKPADLADIIVHAVRLGYRHLDTASMYRTKPMVGAAVAESVRAGAVRSCADLFVTSKLWISDARPGRVVPAIRDSLARLGLAYLDLFLVHWPVAATIGGVPVDKGTLMEFDMEGVWRGMEESGAGDLVIREGRVCPDRQIGGGGGCVSSGEEEERIGTSFARGAMCLQGIDMSWFFWHWFISLEGSE